MVPHLHVSSFSGAFVTGPTFNLGSSRPSPHPWSLSFAAIQQCVTVVRHLHIHGLLLICRSLKDRRLSWHGRLTRSAQFTHKVVTCQPYIGRRSGKVCRPKTDILTTEQHPQVCCVAWWARIPPDIVMAPYIVRWQDAHVCAVCPPFLGLSLCLYILFQNFFCDMTDLCDPTQNLSLPIGLHRVNVLFTCVFC